MLLGEVFQSVTAWQGLAGINMKPKIAYKILKYTKKVAVEQEHVEKMRVALIHEVTGTKEGEEVKIEPDTSEFKAYLGKLNEIMLTESDLALLDMDFEEIVNAVDDKDESLSVRDMALLEPFFAAGCDCCE